MNDEVAPTCTFVNVEKLYVLHNCRDLTNAAKTQMQLRLRVLPQYSITELGYNTVMLISYLGLVTFTVAVMFCGNP